MNHRTNSFFQKEKQLCLAVMSFGIVFTALYFFANSVPPQYTYFFYTLSGFGLIFILNYGYRYIFLSKKIKSIIPEDPSSQVIDAELEWINVRIDEVERYSVILQVTLAIGVILLLVGFAGFMKQLLGSSGLGIIFGAAIWFAAELFSELHLKEYKNYLEQ